MLGTKDTIMNKTDTTLALRGTYILMSYDIV